MIKKTLKPRNLKHVAGSIVRRIYSKYLALLGVKIGKGTMISIGAKIDVRRGVIIIGRNCTITHGCVILSHDYAAAIMGKEKIGIKTVIEDDVFIGVNTVVLAGVVVGKGSIIGAGSVVAGNIPAYSLAVGNPAKIVKRDYRK